MSEQEAAANRVRTFIAARDRYRNRITSNPLPNLIMAEYGVLDVEDLRVLVGEVSR